jgi:hypothetical protein
MQWCQNSNSIDFDSTPNICNYRNRQQGMLSDCILSSSSQCPLWYALADFLSIQPVIPLHRHVPSSRSTSVTSIESAEESAASSSPSLALHQNRCAMSLTYTSLIDLFLLKILFRHSMPRLSYVNAYIVTIWSENIDLSLTTGSGLCGRVPICPLLQLWCLMFVHLPASMSSTKVDSLETTWLRYFNYIIIVTHTHHWCQQ